MGVDYIVRLIEDRADVPDFVKEFLAGVDKEEATIDGKKYYLTMDWNGDSNPLRGEEDEKFEEWFSNELTVGNAAYGNFG